MARILLIEDSPSDQQELFDTLSGEGHAVSTMSDPDQALATVEQWAEQVNLVIVEEAMHGHQGLAVLREAHRWRKSLPVVIVTRDAEWEGYADALSEGAVGYFPYPIDRRNLLSKVGEALTQGG